MFLFNLKQKIRESLALPTILIKNIIATHFLSIPQKKGLSALFKLNMEKAASFIWLKK